ncbi:TatD family hydrolase [Clostridium sardiniense]|uniref:TatD family hydrolase n=1 Tax=Clostridium sardiniense TaxID=29369 RepID=A0ABS7KYW2_CLOSR|nr:TatD family hydrolase [Clostridium sardiniense]MBY0756006.1 TatD family hydrolase [Clostridium sardiniense]MDQ0460703.1 TatD DNase family protein [Clostridium sardiniense]
MEKKYRIFDTHAHYDSEDYDIDRNEVFKELKENGVIGILNCASSYDSVKLTDELTKKYDFIYGALGVHPENADELTDERLEIIKEMIKANDKIVAVGEIGLDYYWEENPSREIQKNALRAQMNLAKELKMPVVIHDRDAHKDTLDILKEFPEVNGVVHCFSGSVEFAKECIKLGYYIGFTGVVTFKNSRKIVEVAKEIPVDRMLVETDAPFMAPVPNRGKRNRSDYIKEIIEKIAEIRSINPDELNIQLNTNFFNLIKKDI